MIEAAKEGRDFDKKTLTTGDEIYTTAKESPYPSSSTETLYPSTPTEELQPSTSTEPPTCKKVETNDLDKFLNNKESTDILNNYGYLLPSQYKDNKDVDIDNTIADIEEVIKKI